MDEDASACASTRTVRVPRSPANTRAQELGLSEELKRSLSTTNAIENVNNGIR